MCNEEEEEEEENGLLTGDKLEKKKNKQKTLEANMTKNYFFLSQ